MPPTLFARRRCALIKTLVPLRRVAATTCALFKFSSGTPPSALQMSRSPRVHAHYSPSPFREQLKCENTREKKCERKKKNKLHEGRKIKVKTKQTSAGQHSCQPKYSQVLVGYGRGVRYFFPFYRRRAHTHTQATKNYYVCTARTMTGRRANKPRVTLFKY